jgi:hypothetical protein
LKDSGGDRSVYLEPAECIVQPIDLNHGGSRGHLELSALFQKIGYGKSRSFKEADKRTVCQLDDGGRAISGVDLISGQKRQVLYCLNPFLIAGPLKGDVALDEIEPGYSRSALIVLSILLPRLFIARRLSGCDKGTDYRCCQESYNPKRGETHFHLFYLWSSHWSLRFQQ